MSKCHGVISSDCQNIMLLSLVRVKCHGVISCQCKNVVVLYMVSVKVSWCFSNQCQSIMALYVTASDIIFSDCHLSRGRISSRCHSKVRLSLVNVNSFHDIL